MKYHEPALLKEVIEFLDPHAGKKYIDATLGGGGHTIELLKYGATVLALDRDQEAIDYVKQKFQIGKELIIVKSNFNQIKQIAEENGFASVDGILFDLGVSSHQLEEAQRGFSFQKDGPLDMRMDTSLPITAADIVNNFEERRLHEIFSTYAEEKLSWPIARAICRTRQIKPINSTRELTEIINEVYREKNLKSKINPATKVFQGLRIVVNSELLNLEECLPQTTKILAKGGRLVIISYHSLEDAIVKRFFKGNIALNILTTKPIGPQEIEVKGNPRARSAKLRAAEKIIN